MSFFDVGTMAHRGQTSVIAGPRWASMDFSSKADDGACPRGAPAAPRVDPPASDVGGQRRAGWVGNVADVRAPLLGRRPSVEVAPRAARGERPWRACAGGRAAPRRRRRHSHRGRGPAAPPLGA